MRQNKENSMTNNNENAKIMEKLSYQISSSIGKFFYNLGYLVARNPWKVVLFSWASVAFCSLGFLNFYQEKDPLKLWVPDNIDFLKNTKFIMSNFQQAIRIESIMIISKNDTVLRTEVFDKLKLITDAINDIKVEGENGEEVTLKKLCFKIPLIASYTSFFKQGQRRKRSNDNLLETSNSDNDNFLGKILNPSFSFTDEKYCSLVNALKYGCMQDNVLEMWKSSTVNFTTNDIVDKISSVKYNLVTGHEANFTAMLGGVDKNSSGHIISAKSLLTNLHLHLNFSEIDLNRIGNAAGTEDWATINIMRFEERFLILMEKLKAELETDDIKIYYAAGRSYGDISSKALFQDMDKLFMGVILMMIYMILILSKFSWPEMRFQLTSIGILNVGMAYVSGCGLSSIFLFYSPVHASLFFIILGLGVDDIFVIMSALRKINEESSNLSLPERIAKTLEKAGTSITITSLTDIIAFLVGGTTVLPSLRSFCVFAAMCILMTYLYVVTFFVAVLTIDQRRTERNKNGFIPCISHQDRTPSCEPRMMWRFIHLFYGKFILTKPGKVIVIVSVILLTGFSIHRVLEIKQKFDPMWFIPSATYYAKYVGEHRIFYPDRGYDAGVYMGNLNYSHEIPKIIEMAQQIEKQTDILTHVQSWPISFREFVSDLYEVDIMEGKLNHTQWKFYLSKFLFSVNGGKFQANFQFDQKLTCGNPAGEILISSITFQYHKFENREQFIPARASIEEIVRSANFSMDDDVFVWGKIFGNWFTDEIIDSEIYRNIALALIGVFVCTAFLIVNVQVCFYIFTCVLLSLVSVGGFMELWGLTLDIVTSIGLQLSVGLCIDYAAHIGHTFLTISDENRDRRALKTVESIGGAVLQGGGSTCLAILLLGTSDSYTFRTFFKIFTIVVIFGLFYGTVFLPVILSLFAPKPYAAALKNPVNIDTELVLLNDEKKRNIRIIEQNDKHSEN